MLEYRFIKYLFLLALLPFALSCQKEVQSDGRALLAEVGASRFYKDEMDLLLAAENSSQDSTAFVNEYLERWAMEELYYNMALHNVASTEEIEKLVESYRRSLILNIYQEKLVNQHLKSDVKESDINNFYALNNMLFDANENLLKGLLLVVPAKKVGISNVRRWCARKTPEDFEELEKYCAEHAVAYEYFMDTWTSLEDVSKQTPLSEEQLLERLAVKNVVEFKKDGKIYFVCADSIIKKGDILPIELVSAEIKELLVNSRKAQFVKAKKKELFDEARAKGFIKFYK